MRVDLMATSLAAVLIVRNEERVLAACLDSLRLAVDEIVVVDTGSTDRTVELAKSYTDRAYRSERFTADTAPEDFHFGDARNEALGRCTADWVLSIDADECLVDNGLRAYLGYTRKPSFEVALECRAESLSADSGDNGRTCFVYVPRLFWRAPEVRWRYSCHELPQPFESNQLSQTIAHLWHDGTLGSTSTVERNLTLLKRQLRSVWSLDWSDEDRCKTLCDLGKTYSDHCDWFEAVGCFCSALALLAGEKSLRTADVHYRLAKAFLCVGLLEEAAGHAVSAWRIRPGLIKAAFIVISCMCRLGRYDAAKEWIERVRGTSVRARWVFGDDDDERECEWLDRAEAECAGVDAKAPALV